MESRDRKPPTQKLFAHVEDKDQRESLIAAYNGLGKLLDQSLRREIQRLVKDSAEKSDKEENYLSPNLVLLLADQAGYRRALKQVLTLLP